MARYRLTESRLRGLIREAVKSVLNEKNWKTFAGAAIKSNDRYNDSLRNARENGETVGFDNKDLKRSGKFADAAIDALKKQYPGIVNQNGRSFEPYWNGDGIGFKAEVTEPIQGLDGKTQTLKINRVNNRNDKIDHLIYDKEGNLENAFYGINDEEYPFNDVEKEVVDDMDMFNRVGRLGYENGVGWKF